MIITNYLRSIVICIITTVVLSGVGLILYTTNPGEDKFKEYLKDKDADKNAYGRQLTISEEFNKNYKKDNPNNGFWIILLSKCERKCQVIIPRNFILFTFYDRKVLLDASNGNTYDEHYLGILNIFIKV